MRDVNAIPPGDVGASVQVWLDAARKALELTRSRLQSLITAAKPSASPPDPVVDEPGAHLDSDDWILPDQLPPPDLAALDRALDRDESKAI